MTIELRLMKHVLCCFLGLFILPLFLAAGVRSSLALEDSSGQAAIRVYAVLGKENVAKNENLNIQLRVENGGEGINAAEISLEFSSDLLALQSINDGGSIVNLWVERPREVAGEKCLTGIINCGAIKMSGLIPGGFVGDGLLVSFTFAAEKEGIANIFFNQYASKVFLDRADAKLADVTYELLEIKIAGEGTEENELVLDYFPPERFGILLSKSKLALDNKWFISFSTQDKGSGINRYEIKEKFLGVFDGGWKRGESPYVLSNQSLLSIIKVKAIDNIGLEREEVLVPRRLIEFYVVSVSALLALLIFLLVIKIKRKLSPKPQ